MKLTNAQIKKINEGCQNGFRLDVQWAVLHDEKTLIKNIALDEKFHVEEVGPGKICKEHTECDGQKEKGLKFLDNCKIEEYAYDRPHCYSLHKKYGIGEKNRKTG